MKQDHAKIVAAAEPGDATDRDDRREDRRLITILRVGKLISAANQELCLIRNISEGGLMAHVYSSHAVGDRVVVELKSDHCVAGAVQWVRDENVGVVFDEKIDVAEVLRSQASPGGYRPRAPRLDISGAARLRFGSRNWRVEVRDLSQGGAKVKIDDPLTIGEDAVITIDGLRPIKAVVRWQEFGQAGLEFVPAIPFAELTQWLGLQAEQERPEG